MQEICVGLTPQQYRDIILLLHSIERMSRASPYRKYRPPAVQSYQNHYRTWWRFAYTCVLEENVRRRRRNWQWSNIKAHRTLVRKYVALFKSKLSARKSEASVDKSIEECEELLDVFNITLGRRQAEVQVEAGPVALEALDFLVKVTQVVMTLVNQINLEQVVEVRGLLVLIQHPQVLLAMVAQVLLLLYQVL
jgi:hypothetical protein